MEISGKGLEIYSVEVHGVVVGLEVHGVAVGFEVHGLVV
jgi:hypothetical protein